MGEQNKLLDAKELFCCTEISPLYLCSVCAFGCTMAEAEGGGSRTVNWVLSVIPAASVIR